MLKSFEASTRTADCAFDRCPLPAKFRVQQKQGYASVCKIHYEELASKAAAASCRALGIVTAEQARAYVVKSLARVGKSSGTAWAQRILDRAAAGEHLSAYSLDCARAVIPLRLREPGEDESEASVLLEMETEEER